MSEAADEAHKKVELEVAEEAVVVSVHDVSKEAAEIVALEQVEETIESPIQIEENKPMEEVIEKVQHSESKSDQSLEPPPPPAVTIFATAVISDALDSHATSSDVGALSSILKCKDHLCRNISYVNFSALGTQQLNSGKFEHSLQVEIDVNTANLWENPRSYIFHHLGRDRWTLRDGSSINLIRIHQKR